MKEKDNENKDNLEGRLDNDIPKGGVIIELSGCCNAPVHYTTGVIMAYCSKCNKPYKPTRYYR